MDFNAELTAKIDVINGWIGELSPKGEGLHSVIFDSANYSVKAGGKRLRPLLTYSVCEMLGQDVSSAKHFAAAVEFIHTYSLIHDDLPCMDNDDYRRGLPTNHKKFGEAIALLAGDTLLTYAFETASLSKTPLAVTLKAINEIASAAGADGMIGGQVIDISGAKNYEELKTVHKMKTGALIKLSCRLGAMCAQANEDELKAIDDFADNLGIAFQIMDDILDVQSTQEVLGKPVGSDEKRGIQTYVTLFGIDGAKQKLKEHTALAKAALMPFGKRADFLLGLSEYLLTRNK